MSNYKTEQRAQDEELNKSLWHEVNCPAHSNQMRPDSECSCVFTAVLEHIQERDQALLEAIKKDVEKILVEEINIAHQEPELTGGKTSRLTSAYMRISSLLKDYNLNMQKDELVNTKTILKLKVYRWQSRTLKERRAVVKWLKELADDMLGNKSNLSDDFTGMYP